MSELEDFFCRDRANTERRRLPLRSPQGQFTEHWIEIRSELSDEFREEYERIVRESARTLAAERDPDRRREILHDRKAALRAALVTDWSFKEPFSRERAVTLLRNAPQIADAVDQMAADGELFFGVSDSSSIGLEQKSG